MTNGKKHAGTMKQSITSKLKTAKNKLAEKRKRTRCRENFDTGNVPNQTESINPNR